jgi:phospholipase/carboxylesterase
MLYQYLEKECLQMDLPRLSLVHVTRTTTTSDAVSALLILLHGMEEDEHFIFDRVQHFDPRLIIVSPRGPVAVAPHSYAWLRMSMIEPGRYHADPEEAQQAFLTVLGFVPEAARAYRVGPDRTYLLGFSQGATFAGAVGIHQPESVAGMILIGGPVPEEAFAVAASPERLAHLACFMAHGTEDPAVPIAQMRENREKLNELLLDVTYREYPVRHEISDDCLRDVSEWLTARLDATTAAAESG